LTFYNKKKKKKKKKKSESFFSCSSRPTWNLPYTRGTFSLFFFFCLSIFFLREFFNFSNAGYSEKIRIRNGKKKVPSVASVDFSFSLFFKIRRRHVRWRHWELVFFLQIILWWENSNFDLCVRNKEQSGQGC
jgi:hypothetical protein